MHSFNTIKIVDTYSVKFEHEIINTSILKMVSLQYENIEYVGNKSSIANIEDIFLKENSTFPKKVKKRFHGLSIRGARSLKKNVLATLINAREALTAGTETVIVYNYNNFLSLHVLNTIASLLNRKIVVCCHAELESLYNKHSKVRFGIAYKLINSFFKKASISKNMMFLVFGDSILKNLEPLLPETTICRFKSIDHPYFSITSYDGVIVEQQPGINIGVIGTLNEKKGVGNVVELAKMVNESHRGKITVNTLSKVAERSDELLAVGVKLHNTGKELRTREDYIRSISSMDFIFFPYKIDSYKLTASGAIFEAIFSGKPIIALENDYFKYLFAKFGAFGFLCTSMTELKGVLAKIQNGRIDFVQFKTNIEDMKKKLSPASISLELKTVIDTTFLS